MNLMQSLKLLEKEKQHRHDMWILNSCTEEISSSVIYGESVKDIWKDLDEKYEHSHRPRIFDLRSKIMNVDQDQKSVCVYFIKLKTLWEELSNYRPTCLCSCGGSK